MDQNVSRIQSRCELLMFSFVACSGVCDITPGIVGMASIHIAVLVANTEGKIDGTRIHTAVRLNRDLSIARGSR
jgi:hypothetical protein